GWGLADLQSLPSTRASLLEEKWVKVSGVSKILMREKDMERRLKWRSNGVYICLCCPLVEDGRRRRAKSREIWSAGDG
ncbi:hypothetical protein HAX54_040165, partial [Datura stramonium]|nr:hypothetical protein [Datura stramonium]